MPSIRWPERPAGPSDPGPAAKVLRPPPEIGRLWLAATFARMDGFVETAMWAAGHLDFLPRRRVLQPGKREHRILWQQLRRRRCALEASLLNETGSNVGAQICLVAFIALFAP